GTGKDPVPLIYRITNLLPAAATSGKQPAILRGPFRRRQIWRVAGRPPKRPSPSRASPSAVARPPPPRRRLPRRASAASPIAVARPRRRRTSIAASPSRVRGPVRLLGSPPFDASPSAKDRLLLPAPPSIDRGCFLAVACAPPAPRLHKAKKEEKRLQMEAEKEEKLEDERIMAINLDT
ncbi:hypothetical protein EJB05_50703, partial [Eragrostis curvula]